MTGEADLAAGGDLTPPLSHRGHMRRELASSTEDFDIDQLIASVAIKNDSRIAVIPGRDLANFVPQNPYGPLRCPHENLWPIVV
ncbi:MAG TPA: hypothetical protein VGX23_33470 [Actinocrinis sp.]|nr:hypothetical protein [Actinocrinis sp.]